MRGFGSGIVLGACLVELLTMLTGKDSFNCACFVVGVGFLYSLNSKR